MRPHLALQHLAVRDLRNLERVDLEPGARLTVVSGKNGSGKTSLLEAIYFAATTRSFRTRRLAELVRHGQEAAVARARFTELGPGEAPERALGREQSAAARAGSGACTARLGKDRPPSLASFATRSPVVVFHPDELALSSGPAAGRRLLLDRLALYVDPSSGDARARYAHALRSRQRLLQRSSPGASAEPRAAGPAGRPDLDAFERLAAEHGAALSRARRAAAEVLVAELLPAFRRIGAPDLELDAAYAPGGSEDPDEAEARLREGRARDAFRPSAGFGPHRDDLALSLGARPVRIVASQGQHRAVTLALKAAERAAVAGLRGLEPILLLDDVSSELDPDRTAALFDFLALAEGQAFLTTTRPELIATPSLAPGERRDFEVSGGELREPTPR